MVRLTSNVCYSSEKLILNALPNSVVNFNSRRLNVATGSRINLREEYRLLKQATDGSKRAHHTFHIAQFRFKSGIWRERDIPDHCLLAAPSPHWSNLYRARGEVICYKFIQLTYLV